MDDDAGPQSLFVVVSRNSAVPYSASIIQLETQVHNHEYASSSAIETGFSAHIPRLPRVQRPIPWAISLPPESCTEDLYFLPDWSLRISEIEKVAKLPGFIFNLSSKKCKIIKPPLASKYLGHAVTMGDHIYFMAQPCWGRNSPGPRFERYDTLSQSWEERKPLPPIFTNHRIELIQGTAVLDDDTILFNIPGLKMWAYNVGRDNWYPVTVLNHLCYNIVGVAVVLNKIIYALTDYCESVVALTLKSLEIEGDLVFTCDLHKEYVVPGMEERRYDLWDSYHLTRHLVHLGKDNKFCVVQSCNNDNATNQYIYLTYIEVSEENLIVTNSCVHDFKLPIPDQFTIKHCFCLPSKCKTTAFKEGNRVQEAEIVTLPPELLQFQDKYSSQTNIIVEQGGSVGPTSQCRDDADTKTCQVQEDVPKKSSSQSRDDADTKTRQVREDVPKKSSASSQSRDDADTKTRQVQEDVPKKSSASVVAGKSKVPSKASTVTGHQSHVYATKASTLGIGAASGKSITDEEGHSICVTNLPLDANSRQLISRLKRFGPIKGVVIQTYFDINMRECCFGHVEFKSATSKQNAIQASTMEIGGRIAVIEEKRGTGLTQVDSNRSSSSHRNKLKKHGFEDSRSKTTVGKDYCNHPKGELEIDNYRWKKKPMDVSSY